MTIYTLDKEAESVIFGYYENLQDRTPLSQEAYTDLIDDMVDAIVPELRKIATVEVDGEGSEADWPDFHISTFADAGREFVIVSDADGETLEQAVTLIGQFLSERGEPFIVLFDSVCTFAVDYKQNCFAMLGEQRKDQKHLDSLELKTANLSNIPEGFLEQYRGES